MNETDVNNMIPVVVNSEIKTVILNMTRPVSANPLLEGTKRNDNYPIIVVPGIMGSRLFDKKGGLNNTGIRQVWPPVYRPDTDIDIKLTVFQTEELAIGNVLYTVDYTIEQNTLERVKPKGMTYVVSNSIGLDNIGGREYGAIKAYEKLVDKLCERFPDREIFFFSYDWRQNNDRIAGELSRFIKHLTTRICFDTGKPMSNKVDLICHSMGGLVASSMAAVPATVRSPMMRPDADLRSPIERVNKIITLGTPYEGSVNLLRAILTYTVGDFKMNTALLFGGLDKKIKLNAPAICQLTPA